MFDEDNVVNKKASHYLFTTEGHIVKIDSRFRGSWTDHFDWIHTSDEASCARNSSHLQKSQYCSSPDCIASAMVRIIVCVVLNYLLKITLQQCESLWHPPWYDLPLSREELGQIEALVGLHQT